MALKALIIEFRVHVKKIEKSIEFFERLGSSRRTPAVKKIKISEGTAYWNELSKNCIEIEKLYGKNPDPCYIKEKEDISERYRAYVAELMLIPDGPAGGAANGATQTDEERFVQKQKARFDMLDRAIEDVEKKIDENVPLSNAYCKMKSKVVNDIWNRIQVADEECDLEKSDLDNGYVAKLETYEMKIEDILLALQEGLESPVRSNNSEGVKLPRLEIPKFSGDYFKWVSFRDLFGSMVRDNKNISDAQRMQMLKSHVTNEAETLIADLTVADVNFECAWQRLLNRYDNNRVVVYKHLNKLMNQQLGKTEAKSIKKLLDTTDQILLALTNLNRPTEHWDDWVVLTVTQKLSEDCRKDWERKVGNSKELPTWEQLKEFLEEEFRMLEGVENSQKRHNGQDGKTQEKPKTGNIVRSYHTSIDGKNCVACEEEHKLFDCPVFKKMEVKVRWELAKKQKLCYSCLQRHKDVLRCDKKKPCKKCDHLHSTWLHEKRSDALTAAVGTITNAFGALKQNKKQVLLATALVRTYDVYGRQITLRALIDSGSQGSMITDRAASILQIRPWSTSKQISGLGGNNSDTVKALTLNIKPRFESNISLTIDFYLLKMLTKLLPDSNLNIEKWNHLKGLQLADPTFNKMGQIDMLLGTDVVCEILKSGFIKGVKGTPMAQETTLGWIISGKIDPKYPQKKIKCLVSTTQDETDDISRFWELEELNPGRMLTADEQICEEFFVKTFVRDKNGIFTVKIPFKDGKFGPESLGLSKNQAMARFIQLEKKFARDDKLRIDYTKVIKEYINLGHMVPVGHLPENRKLYYIPHHAVVKPDSLTTKTRVVFDASAKTSTGVSLNECMYTGAKQQHDLLEILVKWRKHKIVFKADAEKMYRMVKLDENDQRYHTIVWRENPSQPIQEYQLTTATFGTAAAPFMATRTLIQIGVEGEKTYPLASEIIQNDFYVDDLISGCSSLENAIQRKNELIDLLDGGGFKLRKWTSNSKELLETLPEEITEKALQLFDDEGITKALGIQWNPKSDTFTFQINWMQVPEKLTKRQFLSEASKLFDPLGWLAPVIINAKMMMQEIWQTKIDWDNEVPEIIKTKWQTYRKEFPLLEKLSIDRWIKAEPNSEVSLHGFADASEKGYGAVVYTRIKTGHQITIKLIGAKTRVSPVSSKISLPRLELCGAVLVGNLLKTVEKSLNLGTLEKHAWTDSMITLGWINKEPTKWKTFVANRVAEIQGCQIDNWRYVKSAENPADCASRGLMPGEILSHKLWWNGPTWLKEEPNLWPVAEIAEIDDESKRIVVNVATVQRQNFYSEASSWFKKTRVLAYCLRMKTKKKSRGPMLQLDELKAARNILYRTCQQEAFPDEMDSLATQEPLSTRSRLLQLNPFLDNDGIMRVGGRLQNAVISYENKHPIILPKGHSTTKLIIHQMHLDTLHGGPQVMMSLLRKKYWIIQGKRMANDEFKSCVNCRRFCAKTNTQIMGNLPKDRVTLERAFVSVGVDYCGPIEVRSSRLRNAKIQKGYIAVFVCFGTRAIHLELVSDMTTPAFMAALNRFIARRGLCERMYSDNGSNFLGTAIKLAAEEKQWLHEKNQELASLTINRGIDWKFIPPGSPNFGGLWERGVRSVKEHLKRTLKTSRLTFEEYATVLCQIEACLNSRPLCALTNDAENLNALTPGHFLIGDALLAPPQPNLLDINANRLDRWRHLQLLQQHFWQRWNTEYLSQLQQRKKWQKTEENVKIGDLILIKDEQLPPKNWLMARIVDVHPGTDGRIRVVTLRTRSGEIKQPINKICPLLRPNELENESEAIEESQEQPDIKEMEYHDLGPDVKEIEVEDEIKTTRMTNRKEVNQNQAEQQSNQPSKYGLRPRRSNTFVTFAAIFGMLLLIGGGSALEPNSIKISKFSHNAGIYFEDIGRANIIRTDWHIYLRFDLKQYLTEFARLQKIVTQVSELCSGFDSTSTRGHCEDMAMLAEHQTKSMTELNSLLTTNGDEYQMVGHGSAMRKRRAAPLNVIGWIQHELFGVMAAEQADHIADQFKLVARNSNHLLKLFKNQTSIVESTMNLMKITQSEINKNYEKIEKSLHLLAKETNYLKRKIQMMTLSIITLAFGNRLEKIQDNILDMLTELHQGHVASQLFTPNQFKKQLELMTQHSPVGSKLPKIAQEDIKSLYKIIKGSARVTDSDVILDIVFPLVTASEFQIMKIIPIPTEHQGHQITIVPESAYLLMNLQKDRFYQVNDKEIHTCMKPRARSFICSLSSPLYSTQSNESRCEREFIMQKSKISSSCKFIVTSGKEFWIKLHTQNQWIFGVKSKITLNVVCGNQAQSTQIEGSGIVELAPGCEIILPGMTIIAETVKQTMGEFNYYPTINLSEAVIKSGQHNDFKMENLTLDHHEQLNMMFHQIKELKQQSRLEIQRHSYTVNGIIGIIIIMGIITTIIWFNRITIWQAIKKTSTIDQNKEEINGVDDVEGGEMINTHHLESHHASGSDDIKEHNTASRHRAGECPFRT